MDITNFGTRELNVLHWQLGSKISKVKGNNKLRESNWNSDVSVCMWNDGMKAC